MISNPEEFEKYYFDNSWKTSTGSTCVVFKTLNRKDNKFYATKVIDSKEIDPKVIESEITCLSGLNHPNIVQLYEYYFLEGKHILVFEWLEGNVSLSLNLCLNLNFSYLKQFQNLKTIMRSQYVKFLSKLLMLSDIVTKKELFTEI